MAQTYDFVIVGGGTAGCHIARRLADTKSKPKVALLEAGLDLRKHEVVSMIPSDRYANGFWAPDSNYGYMTTPQEHLGNQITPYLRGKGLGGSSALNYMTWCKGAAGDYNRWADLVGDETWAWKHTKERYKRIEKFNMNFPEDMREFVNPAPDSNGTDGPVEVCVPATWEMGVKEVLAAAIEEGYGINADPNSGNPLGVSFMPSSCDQKIRVTSATANLTNPPSNLSVIQDASVHKIIFDGKKAIGVLCANGNQILGNEVVVCCGTLDTPKLLMLSGIGSAQELGAFNIPVVHDLPGVGKNLMDHLLAFMTCDVAPGLVEKWFWESDVAAVKAAHEQWAKDQTGPAVLHDSTILVAWLKENSLFDLPCFKGLDKKVQEYLKDPTVPNLEIVLFNCPSFPPGSAPTPPNAYLTLIPIAHNLQSRGTISLASADPNDHPLINPNCLSDVGGYDRAVLTVAVKKVFEFVKSPRIAKYFQKWTYAPTGDSDEEIHKFIGSEAKSLSHASGTTKMGKEDDPTACVDTYGRVYGVQQLRVADLSVVPVITTNHTQPTAYLVAQTVAELMIEEYGL